MSSKLNSLCWPLVSPFLGLSIAVFASPASVQGYVVTKLVSDQAGQALVQDPNLVNPWGIAASATSPFWVANNGTGTSTLYTSTGATNVTVNALVVSMPGTNPNTGAVTPITGTVFNGGTSFNGDRFIFAAEDGTISGWGSGTTAAFTAMTPDANYKGLAIGTNGVGDHLYAADFAHSIVNVFDSAYSQVSLPGLFTDPNLPAGYAPFGIRNINDQLYVTYAVRNPSTGDDVAGPGNGLVDVYDLNGSLVRRLVTGGALNSPWGLALAPAGFGTFGGDLLVGNFGDGAINAYDPVTGDFLGTMKDSSNSPVAIDGLWGLSFGNGGNGGATDVLYFTAGPGEEAHGLFGSIAVPEPGALALLLGAVPLGLLRRRCARSETEIWLIPPPTARSGRRPA
jgi:uncharacterized protein (TIGR03118 family)